MSTGIILLTTCSSPLLGCIFRCIAIKADSEYKETKASTFFGLSVLYVIIFILGLSILLLP
mgnify:CR=1 FL=1